MHVNNTPLSLSQVKWNSKFGASIFFIVNSEKIPSHGEERGRTLVECVVTTRPRECGGGLKECLMGRTDTIRVWEEGKRRN